MTQEDFALISHTLPTEPGVYRFIDVQDVVIYVGKAKNLKNRLTSYFTGINNQAFKTRTMVKHASSLEFTIVETETDALLFENTLIKKLQPRYNVMLKDAKSYTYLCVKNEAFPRVFFTRKVYRDGSKYFGPYTSKYKTKQIFEIIKQLFPLRTCKLNLKTEVLAKANYKVCLEYHLKNCMGPCVNLETEEEYDEKIAQIRNILEGNFKPVKDHIKKEMHRYARKLEFEKADQMKEKMTLFEEYQSKSTVVSHTIKDVDVFSIVKDSEWAYINYLKVINGAIINTDTIEVKMNLDDEEEDILEYVIPEVREKYNSIANEIVVKQKIKMADSSIVLTVPLRGDKKNLLELSEKNVIYYQLQKKKEALGKQNKQSPAERILRTLQSDLNMKDLPIHIECFDNSNIQGTNPVASCVVFKNAKPAKKDYRKFNIKTVEGPDDFASMEEVVYRRYKRLLEENESLPQLVIIDGGKGQLHAAVNSLEKLQLTEKITLIGIAKRLEEIFFPKDSIPLYINKKSESLKLIQQARNEAHRFALGFHRDQRSKNFIENKMEEIEGIGEKTSQKLLSHFGSFKRIQKAKIEDIASIIGNQKAKLLIEAIHKGLE